jgi:hypothetical protein
LVIVKYGTKTKNKYGKKNKLMQKNTKKFVKLGSDSKKLKINNKSKKQIIETTVKKILGEA